ncbi:TetR family transcriptional regulator [Pseudomonas sp. CMR5c]|uniref:TetR family transcriptional regulator n=1 Tax=Pseudomonas TaxID=286 RepID=UPI00069DDCE0|nr:TetR family transcriptional regulator [Pseudomonas sp. CMR5c]AZC17929.1 Transcriptional regulator, AcrR family [Pseudomonas sp. CMR5c]
MSKRQSPRISSRKQPQQSRSTELVAAILQAAIQVLTQQGAKRFTTARVAEKAGVSIGSLYQYFPNKAAILFRLQSDEWLQTRQMLSRILDDQAQAPLARLRSLVHAFIRSECEEAPLRSALNEAAPLYRDAPEAGAARAAGRQIFTGFMHQLLPDASEATRAAACELILSTLSSVGKDFSSKPHTKNAMTERADGLADMFSAYVVALAQPGPATASKPLDS